MYLTSEFNHPQQVKAIKGMVAFELKIMELKTKVKFNQHRPESHEAMHAAYAQGGEQAHALAMWMHRLGMVGQ
jgi:transcriptional regulator